MKFYCINFEPRRSILFWMHKQLVNAWIQSSHNRLNWFPPLSSPPPPPPVLLLFNYICAKTLLLNSVYAKFIGHNLEVPHHRHVGVCWCKNYYLYFAWSISKPITTFVAQMVQYLLPSYRKLQKVFACHHVSLRATKYHNYGSSCLTFYELSRYSDTCHKARVATSLPFLPWACLT